MYRFFIAVLIFWYPLTLDAQNEPVSFEELAGKPSFQSFEEALKRAGEVYKLDLAGMDLKGVPGDFAKLKKLQLVNLAGNPGLDFSKVIPALAKLPNLQVLYLSANQLAAIPEAIGEMNALQELYLDVNQLSSLANGFARLKSLRILSLRGNNTLGVAAAIDLLAGLPELQLLDLGACGMTSLPEGITKLSALKQLALNENKLTTFPDIFGQMQGLISLELSSNGLEKLPEEVVKAPRLLVLDLSRNPKLDIDQALGLLASSTKIRVLNLSENGIEFLPDAIGSLVYLQALDLGYNKMLFLPSEIGKLRFLQKLILRQNEISVLPAEIKHLKKLKELNMLGNPIQYLPSELDSLVALQSVVFVNTQVSEDDLRKLKAALPGATILPDPDYQEEEDIPFISLDEALKIPEKVTTLNLSGQGLEALPPSITQLSNLQQLDLGGNPALPFDDLMGLLAKLPYLQVLGLQENGLASLPKGLEKLKLRQLFLSNNQFMEASERFSALAGLEILFLAGNPMSAEEKEKVKTMLPGTLVF